MPRARHVAHSAGLHVRAVHDGRVQLVLTIRGKIRAPSRVEERIVFQNANRGLDRIERRAAPVQHLRAGLRGLGKRGAIRASVVGFMLERSIIPRRREERSPSDGQQAVARRSRRQVWLP
jgi:hypothetical protein